MGIQDAAPLYVGNLLGIRALLVLFRIIVRAVIRESTSTESGLLQKQRHKSFYTKWGAISYSWAQTKAGDFFQYLLQAISYHIFDSGTHLQN